MSVPSQSFHRCPSCKAVRPGSVFRPAPFSERPYGAVAVAWLRCPECQHVAPSHAFRQVEPPAEREGQS